MTKYYVDQFIVYLNVLQVNMAVWTLCLGKSVTMETSSNKMTDGIILKIPGRVGPTILV